ncbi:hypothetical protein HK102_007206 [Quaeritorhiza haematococci]|nr:hypothetical protein HK102_007206 [Quaeritorhiza haematococci]
MSAIQGLVVGCRMKVGGIKGSLKAKQPGLMGLHRNLALSDKNTYIYRGVKDVHHHGYERDRASMGPGPSLEAPSALDLIMPSSRIPIIDGGFVDGVEPFVISDDDGEGEEEEEDDHDAEIGRCAVRGGGAVNGEGDIPDFVDDCESEYGHEFEFESSNPNVPSECGDEEEEEPHIDSTYQHEHEHDQQRHEQQFESDGCEGLGVDDKPWFDAWGTDRVTFITCGDFFGCCEDGDEECVEEVGADQSEGNEIRGLACGGEEGQEEGEKGVEGEEGKMIEELLAGLSLDDLDLEGVR